MSGDDALEFLRQWSPGGPVQLTAIEPDTRAIESRYFAAEAGRAEWIAARNGKFNIYFTVNPLTHPLNKKPNKADIAAMAWAHVDVDPRDGETPEQCKRRLQSMVHKFQTRPTVMINSGNGVQLFWRLREPIAINGELDKLEGINRALEKAFGGDHCHNIDRIMRVPGTMNLPDAKKRAKGRVPVEASLAGFWDYSYDVGDLPWIAPARANGAAAAEIDLSELPPAPALDALEPWLRTLVVKGKSEGDGFPSRSEAVWAAICGLVKAGLDDAAIAAVLLAPAFGISARPREDPTRLAREIGRARAEVAANGHDAEPPEDEAPPHPGLDGDASDSDWLMLLMRTNEGAIKSNIANCFIVLQHCPDLADKIAYDRRAQRIMLLRDCPVARAGSWHDEFTSKLVAWLQRTVHMPARVNEVTLAIEAVALDAAYDPLVDWLLDLRWDGIERIGMWLQDYCACSENGTASMMGSKFLIGAVARALRPGCRMDNMLVLESTQGYGKTKLVNVLGGPFAGETLPDFHSRDAMQIAGAKWIIEVPELSSMNRSQIDEVKAFITRTEDTYVPKYKRNPVTVKRGCVLVGTVNPAGPGYLLDTTGNRRYWPVKVGRIDTERLERDRAQLFAEAVYCFNRGDPWWIESEEQEDLMAAEQDLRVQHDDWVDIIARWIENEPIMVDDRVVWQPRSIPLEQTTGPDIAKDCLGLPFKDFNRSQQTRVGMAMKLLGFDHVRIRQGQTLTWGYKRLGIK